MEDVTEFAQFPNGNTGTSDSHDSGMSALGMAGEKTMSGTDHFVSNSSKMMDLYSPKEFKVRNQNLY